MRECSLKRKPRPFLASPFCVLVCRYKITSRSVSCSPRSAAWHCSLHLILFQRRSQPLAALRGNEELLTFINLNFIGVASSSSAGIPRRLCHLGLVSRPLMPSSLYRFSHLFTVCCSMSVLSPTFNAGIPSAFSRTARHLIRKPYTIYGRRVDGGRKKEFSCTNYRYVSCKNRRPSRSENRGCEVSLTTHALMVGLRVGM